MLNLKAFLVCCCENSANTEEEKVEKQVKNIGQDAPTNVKPQGNESEIEAPKNYDQSTIIAAPAPGEELNYPKLSVKILESTMVPIGTILKISPTGMEGSKRAKSDYKTYIGSKFMEGDEILNDFVIEEEDQGMGKQHFLIKFNNSSLKYTISDLGDGTGTFIKVDTDLLLKENYIISFGSSHMKVISSGTIFSLDKKLVLKFLEGPKLDEEFTFQPNDDAILIGRMADCRIRFEDSNLSRYQCNISYHGSKGWILKDGVGEKSSTNGTWLYVEEEFEIYNKLIFKAGKTLFKIKINSNSDKS